MSLRASVYSLRSRFASARRVRLRDTVGAAAMLAVVAAGCEPSASTSSRGAGPKAAVAASAADGRCQQLLSSGLDMMKPENLGISAQEQQVVDALNNWAGECGKSLPATADDPPRQKRDGEAFADLYDVADIEHVRNCWLIKQLGSEVLRSQSTDLDRVVGLFNLSVRTVALLSSSEPAIPQTPYDTLVIGRGTAEDRAWLFGELLRQAGVDSVIVRPKANGPAASSPAAASAVPASAPGASSATPRWLVGVLLDKQVYLFDPTLGWPLPSAEDKGTSAMVRQPATLAQVVAHDELLRKLDLSPEKKYPLRAADLKSVQAEIITSNRYSEPRIKRIESFLAGNRSTAVYAPLVDVGGRPGLRARVEAGGAGAWKKEDVAVWEYPDKQISAAHHLDNQAKTLHDTYWLPFEGPVELEFDPKTMHLKVVSGTKIMELKGGKAGRNKGGAFPGQGDESDRVEVRTDARKQIKARIAQLQGDYPKAIRKYLMVQLEELPPAMPLPEEVQERVRNLPPDKRPKGEGPLAIETPKREFFMNLRAAEDAKFWMGVCQMDQHEADLAEETFNAYLRRFGQGGIGTWVVQAAYLRSLTLAESKKFALAVQAINQLAQALPESDFRRPTFELLGERWRVVRDAAKPPTSGTESPSQSESAAANPKSEPTTAKAAGIDKTPTAAPSPPPKTSPATPPSSDPKSATKPKSP